MTYCCVAQIALQVRFRLTRFNGLQFECMLPLSLKKCNASTGGASGENTQRPLIQASCSIVHERRKLRESLSLKTEECPQATPKKDFSVYENPSFAILLVGRPIAMVSAATSEHP